MLYIAHISSFSFVFLSIFRNETFIIAFAHDLKAILYLLLDMHPFKIRKYRAISSDDYSGNI
jgi:hypothetical protein